MFTSFSRRKGTLTWEDDGLLRHGVVRAGNIQHAADVRRMRRRRNSGSGGDVVKQALLLDVDLRVVDLPEISKYVSLHTSILLVDQVVCLKNEHEGWKIVASFAKFQPGHTMRRIKSEIHRIAIALLYYTLIMLLRVLPVGGWNYFQINVRALHTWIPRNGRRLKH